MGKKIILAYSGGLDTSCCVKWLKEKGWDVVCFMADVGQKMDRKTALKRARQAGASNIYISDLVDEFVKDFIGPTVKAQARYEGKYYMATSLSRPLIAKALVGIAEKEKAVAVAHGCTGKGNDQVRIEVGVRMLNPRLQIVAPVREWEFGSREEEIEYCQRHGIEVDVTKKKPYSIDENIWGVSIECGVLEDPSTEPPSDAYQITKDPFKSKIKPEYIKLGFKGGLPDSLNGRKKAFRNIIEDLNEIGGRHGIGRIDMIEDRLIGIKSREIYESPAAHIIYTAIRELDMLVSDKDTLMFKRYASDIFANQIYNGLWFAPLTEALRVFFDHCANRIEGEVILKLGNGLAEVVGRRSPYSRYKKALATYDEGDAFDHKMAEGFIKIWGLPYEMED